MSQVPREIIEEFSTNILCPKCEVKHLYISGMTDHLRLYCPKPECNYILQDMNVKPKWLPRLQSKAWIHYYRSKGWVFFKRKWLVQECLDCEVLLGEFLRNI